MALEACPECGVKVEHLPHPFGSAVRLYCDCASRLRKLDEGEGIIEILAVDNNSTVCQPERSPRVMAYLERLRG